MEVVKGKKVQSRGMRVFRVPYLLKRVVWQEIRKRGQCWISMGIVAAAVGTGGVDSRLVEGRIQC